MCRGEDLEQFVTVGGEGANCQGLGAVKRPPEDIEVVPLPVELRWRSTWSSGGDHGFIMSHGSDSFGGDVRVEGGA